MFKALINYLITILKFLYLYKMRCLILFKIIPYLSFRKNFHNFSYITFLIRIMDDVLLLRRVDNYTLDVNCFIDVGANQGMTSLAYKFLNHKDDNHILMFEPIENCSRSLNELCKINKNFTFIT